MRVLIGIFWGLAILLVLCFALAFIGPLILSSGLGMIDPTTAHEMGPGLMLVALIGAVLLTYFGARDKVLPFSWAEFKAARILIKVLTVFGVVAVLGFPVAVAAGMRAAEREQQLLANPKPSGIVGQVLTVGPCGYTFTAPDGWTWSKAPSPQGEVFACSNKLTKSKIVVTVTPVLERSFPVEGMRGVMKAIKGSAERENVTVVNDQFCASDQPIKNASYRATFTLRFPSGRSLDFVHYVGLIHGQLLTVECNTGESPELVAVLKSQTELK